MSSDQHPIPREALPPGWGPAECCDGYLAYRHTRPPIELVADRTAADGSHPGLGLGHCWVLQYQYSLEDRTITESIGRVPTRRAAIDGILECMSRVCERVEKSDGPAEVRNALESIELDDFTLENPSL